MTTDRKNINGICYILDEEKKTKQHLFVVWMMTNTMRDIYRFPRQ